MKLEALTIEELFEKSGKHEELIRLIDRIICETAPDLRRELFSGSSFTMAGYGEIPGDDESEEDSWPLISVAPQKRTVNLYIAAEKDGVPLPQYFVDSFGKSAVGKSCIRISSVKKLDKAVLRELIRETLLWADLKTGHYGKSRAAVK